MNIQIKRRIAFALLMGIVTTGIISLLILIMNLGFSGDFVRSWLRSWAVGYAIVVPVILLVGPLLQSQVDRLIK